MNGIKKNMTHRNIYILPFNRLECENKIFEYPFFKSLREFLFSKHIRIDTIDKFDFKSRAAGDTLIVFNHPEQNVIKKIAKRMLMFFGCKKWVNEKYFTNYKKYFHFFKRKVLYQWESPTITPIPYHHLEKLKQIYDKMLFTVRMKGFDYFHYPQTRVEIFEKYFNHKNRKFITLINANKQPASYKKELYTERLLAIKYFSDYGLDLYGRGWDTQIKFSALFKQYIDKSFRGSVDDKYKTLSKYKFAICYENSAYPGWVTEKIFDCFLVGTVPIYLGAPDIGEYVPKECFIDFSGYKDYNALNKYLRSMSEEGIESRKEAIRIFLSSDKVIKFREKYFFENILSIINESHKQYI
jgi:hypothetical protein